MKNYLLQLIIAADQFVCALCGGFADETISSYLYRLDVQKKLAGRMLRPVIDMIWRSLRGTPDHCKSAYDAERLRAQLPPELRS